MKNLSVDQLIQKLKQIRIQETEVLEQLEEARARETTSRSPQVPPATADPNLFEEGDQIRITNKVRLPRGRAVTDGDRLAVVTDIQGDKVYFITNNGTKTWRLFKNIRTVGTH